MRKEAYLYLLGTAACGRLLSTVLTELGTQT